MCTFSAIHDYGRNMDPNRWDKEMLAEFHKLIEAAKQFDKISGQPDCEDPEKTKWIEVVERKVDSWKAP